MSLDVYLRKKQMVSVFDANITHNLNQMAAQAGIYDCLWRPDENGYTHASQLIKPLEKGLNELKGRPHHYKKYNPPNGWGTYDDFIPWLESYLQACKDHPDAEIEVSR